MPVNTNTSSTTPPEVVVNVGNGGGGTGSTARLHVFLCWDPAILSLMSVDNPAGGGVHSSAADGYCVWYGHSVTWGNSKDFKVRLCRRRRGATWVITSAMDVHQGIASPPTVWLVPSGYPSCRSQAAKSSRRSSRRPPGRRKA